MDRERDLLGHFERGMALYKGGRVDEAIDEFQAALAIDPKHAPSHYNLALRLESKGRNAEAAAAFESFLSCANASGRKLEPIIRDRITALRSGGTLSLDGRQGSETRTIVDGATAAVSPATGVTWHPGDVIDGLYEIREVLGEGGFGSVHKVFHRGWGMDLAVKAPLASKVANRRALEAFVQEANAWVGLGLHPHIVTCFFVRVMGVPRIFIEFMAGGSLADWLAAGKAKEAKVALDCAIQISRAMEYVHRRGLVHRDLKPGNCLMMEDGTLKVTDFGLVHVGEEDEGPQTPQTPGAKIAKVKASTMTGRLGTPEYMAPEQWTKPREAGKSADVWAFGVMLYELLCGRKPFAAQDDEPIEAFYARLSKSDWAYHKPQGHLPWLNTLIERCLTVDPERRPQDFEGLTGVLEAAYALLVGQAYSRQVVKEPPILADTLVNQGVSMADLGRSDEALRLFREALRLDPLHAGAIFDEGMLLMRLGKGSGDVVSRLAAIDTASGKNRVAAWLLELARAAKAGGRVPDLYVSRPTGTEQAQEETTAFHADMEAARNLQGKGEYQRAYDVVRRARTVPGYERSESALALMRELGARGTRVGLAGGWPQVVFPGSGGAVSLEFSFAGTTLTSRHSDGTRIEWDPRTGTFLAKQLGEHGAVLGMVEARTEDGRFLLVGRQDGALEVVELKSERLVLTLKGHEGAIAAMLLSPEGGTVYTAGPDAIKRWELDWEFDLRPQAPEILPAVGMNEDLPISWERIKAHPLFWPVLGGALMVVFGFGVLAVGIGSLSVTDISTKQTEGAAVGRTSKKSVVYVVNSGPYTLWLFGHNSGSPRRLDTIDPKQIQPVIYEGYERSFLKVDAYMGQMRVFQTPIENFSGGSWVWVFDGREVRKTQDLNALPKGPPGGV